MIKKIKNITLFIDDKVIKDAKIIFSRSTTDITLPQKQAIKETNNRHLRLY